MGDLKGTTQREVFGKIPKTKKSTRERERRRQGCKSPESRNVVEMGKIKKIGDIMWKQRGK